MRLLLDLQAIQGSARNRGLGRYSLEFAAAMGHRPEVDETLVLLNGGFAPDALISARELVRRRIPGAKVAMFDAPWPWSGDPSDVEGHRRAEAVREQFIHELSPDAVVVCSPLSSPAESVVSVSEGSRPPTAVIVHDLFQVSDLESPLADRWRPWLQHRIQSLARADLLLCNSDFLARQVKEYLGDACPPTTTIWGAAFGVPGVEVTSRRGVLVTGGGDDRMNVAAPIRAFARLPESLRRRHPLALVGRPGHPDLEPGRIARALGLSAQECMVVGTGFSNEELARWYAGARVVAVPGRSEGLCLPVLEAWRSGTPAITSNVTSLPELVGDSRWTFEPDDEGAQASLLEQLLGDDAVWEEAAAHAVRRASAFTWTRTAELAMGALSAAAGSSAPRTETGRPTLAFATPWPPQSSGVARHARVMAEALGVYYRITIVNGDDAASAQARSDGYETITPAEFDMRPDGFDRVLVQIGNNPLFHVDELRLLKRWPCVAVAHDLDLHHLIALDPRSYSGGMPALRYAEHGLAGWLTPEPQVGIDIYRSSLGVIVHSDAAVDYLTSAARSAMPVEMVHRAPLVIISEARLSKAEARQRLGIDETQVVVASFGRVTPSKGLHTLIEAFQGLNAGPAGVSFAIVGPSDDRAYRDRLEALAQGLPLHFTGEIDDSSYAAWLAAVDIAVQLRPVHRGETSGAVLEALSAGCATVVEGGGSLRESTALGAIAVPSPVAAVDLRDALQGLVDDPEGREALQREAATRTWEVHNPKAAALRYRDAIEESYRRSAIPPSRRPTDINMARSLSINRPDREGATVYLDVTSLVESTRRTGIERVTASLGRALAVEYPGRVFPIMQEGEGLRHAPEVISDLMGEANGPAPTTLPSNALRFREGDLLLSAELKSDVVLWGRCVAGAKSQGARYAQVLCDLLPLRLPEFFPGYVEPQFGQWLEEITRVADLVACISEATEDDFRDWLQEKDLSANSTWFRLAFDVGLPQILTPELRERSRGKRRVLFVGTIEPRKGIEVVLDAAEWLWATGEDVEFVVVGRPGWAPASTLDRLRSLSESGQALRWLDDASDLDLQWEYLNADLLVMASRGEGFGLPIVEAIAHGVPVVARDLPVFRELLGPEGDYFTLDGELAGRILERLWSDAPPAFVADRLVTWRESAQELLRASGGSAQIPAARQSHSEPQDERTAPSGALVADPGTRSLELGDS